jgi:hypothetical protein
VSLEIGAASCNQSTEVSSQDTTDDPLLSHTAVSELIDIVKEGCSDFL